MIRWIIAVLLVLIIASCSHKISQVPDSSTSVNASVVPVLLANAAREVEVHGTIHAAEDAVLSSRAMGPIVREHAKLGDRVAKGQPLLEIEERMSSGQLAQAKGALAQATAGLAVAERNYRRFQSLLEKKACSELESDMAKMQYEQAKGAVEQAQGAVDAAGSVADESIIRAPFDAVVVEKMVNVGDLVAPGRPLVHVQSTTGREIWLTVRAADIRHFHRGDTLEISVDAQPDLATLIARVTEVAPSGDAATQTFQVKAGLNDPTVSAGVGVTAFARGDIHPTLLIPSTAVYSTGGMDLVSVVDSNHIARTRAVTLGRKQKGQIEVLSGLLASDQVVDQRQGPLADGTHINGNGR